MRFRKFCGPSYQLSNPQYECQVTRNMYVEFDEMVNTGKEGEPCHLAPTPGLTLVKQVSIPTGSASRGKYTTSKNQPISIIGSNVYQVTGGEPTSFVYTQIGTLLTNIGIISQLAFADDGNILMMTDGTNGYWAKLNSGGAITEFQQIVDPAFQSIGPTSCCQFYDGYFIVNQIGTNNFYWSNLGILSAGINSVTITSGGTGYTNGSYPNVALTGGSGANVEADIVVSGGAVTSVTITAPGAGYLVIDSELTATVGGSGSGFTVNVLSLSTENQSPSFGGGSAGNDAKSGNNDPIEFLCVINRYLWLVGTQTTEIWYDTPSGTFIFQRIPGPYIEMGCVDGNTAQKTENGLFWLATSLRGGLYVVLTTGENVTTVSTQAVSLALSSYGLTGWSSWSYGERGHMFYILNPPGGTSSWCYDYQTSALGSVPNWHERTFTNPATGAQSRHLANNHCVINGYHLVGDYTTTTDYVLDYNNFTDNGDSITRDRIAPHISADMLEQYHDLFQLDCATGVGSVRNTDGTYRDPLVSLCWSDNGGITYGEWITESIGGTGEYIKRVEYWQLGLCEGANRVYWVRFTDPVNFDIMGASLKLSLAYPN